ncbi:MAG: SIMPL domain-containing protein [Bradyrhizobiaceae bacterium]|nr:SIMPL domain-containing protein [Bradyrhizobiaceae bacterium]
MTLALSPFRAGIVLALPLVLALVFPAAAQEKNVPTLAVTGEGLVAARPDMAVVSVGVVSQAPLARDALAQNSKAMTAVIAAVKEAGIDAKDIETSQLSLRPQYSYPGQGSREAPKLVAYEASNNVSVRVRDLDKLGALLDRLVTSGANQIRGIELTLAEPGPVRDAARVAATKEAMRKANLLADAAGVRIVRILSIAEELLDGPRPVVMRMQAEAAARAPVPIEAGEQEIRARVSAVFEIAPK